MDREKKYEAEKQAKENLARDLVTHDKAKKTTPEQADRIAGDVARKRDQEQREKQGG